MRCKPSWERLPGGKIFKITTECTDYRYPSATKPQPKKEEVTTGLILKYQTAGDFARLNPHWHGLLLEGGFDDVFNFVEVRLKRIKVKENFKAFDVLDFIALVMVYIPPKHNLQLR